MKRISIFVFVVWVTAMPPNASGHGTDYRLISNDAVVAAEFFYSDNTPMQYSEILIYSPDNKKVEYQNGRTDQNGRFAFLAEIPGDWRINVNDGMGHAVQATVTVKPAKSESETAVKMPGNRKNEVSKKNPPLFGDTPMALKIVSGLSILLNIFLGLYVWKRKPVDP